MVFPMFGALYITFGMRFILLPGGPLAPLLGALGIAGTDAAVQPAVGRVRDVDLHVPVHGHEHRDRARRTSTRRSRRPRPASAPGRWQTFRRVVLPLTRAGVVAGIADWSSAGASGRSRSPLLLGSQNEQRALAWTIYQRGVVQTDYGLSTAMGVVLLLRRVRRDVLLAALLARGARRMRATGRPPPSPSPAAPPPVEARKPLLTLRPGTAILGHAYIWSILVSVRPAVPALLFGSFADGSGGERGARELRLRDRRRSATTCSGA